MACGPLNFDELTGRLALARVEGREKARKEVNRRFILNALRDETCTVKQIAKYSKVSMSYVRKVKAEMLDSAPNKAVKRNIVNIKRDKKILEELMASGFMNLEVQMKYIAISHVEAREEERESLTRKHVEIALRDDELSIEKIAEYNEVSVSYVRKVKAEMLAGRKK